MKIVNVINEPQGNLLMAASRLTSCYVESIVQTRLFTTERKATFSLSGNCRRLNKKMNGDIFAVVIGLVFLPVYIFVDKIIRKTIQR